MPTHIKINASESGLAKDSVVLLEQIRTLDKKRLKEKIGSLGENNTIEEINKKIMLSFGIN